MAYVCKYILDFKSILKIEQSWSQFKQYEIISRPKSEHLASLTVKFMKIGFLKYFCSRNQKNSNPSTKNILLPLFSKIIPLELDMFICLWFLPKIPYERCFNNVFSI